MTRKKPGKTKRARRLADLPITRFFDRVTQALGPPQTLAGAGSGMVLPVPRYCVFPGCAANRYGGAGASRRDCCWKHQVHGLESCGVECSGVKGHPGP